jgi:hypothetical protein|tara:strand:+ start:341 stop:457 length:117 start_codon:yes stop_codon:yes gene_type:complete
VNRNPAPTPASNKTSAKFVGVVMSANQNIGDNDGTFKN